VYDRWARPDWLYPLVERGTERARRRAVERLDLERGDTVLDVGCGPGVNFDVLRAAVGHEGRVVGEDLSAGMVARAWRRVREQGWENVHVVRADATGDVLRPGTADAAVSTLALSTMLDADAVVGAVRRALGPAGRLAVLDCRPHQHGPLRVWNPLLQLELVELVDWNPDSDVEASLRRGFGTVTVESWFGGAVYVALATP
jgi:ubiquinone/menaquinone biosynthesis C-methylase UbiE